MKKILLYILAASTVSFMVVASNSETANSMPVHRFYNFKNDSHFYTIDQAEATYVNNQLFTTYRYEGEAFSASQTNPTDPNGTAYGRAEINRYYDTRKGYHFYATSSEGDGLMRAAPHYRYEGVAFYSVISGTFHTTPPKVNRFYNTRTGAHFYTSNENEINHLKTSSSGIYRFEGEPFFTF